MSKLFTIITHDKADVQDIRTEKRAGHLAHFEKIMDKIAVSGPLRNDAGEAVGSLIIVKADSSDEARALLADDPFFTAGIWEKIDIYPFTASAGEWVGGKSW